ncbi:hypothetical protein LCGC14_1942140, partial [marine sediment metagenome]
MILWPLTRKTMSHWIYWDTIIFGGALGIIGGIPVFMGVSVYKFISWSIKNIAFSKEEKVQIAVGSISKEEVK